MAMLMLLSGIRLGFASGCIGGFALPPSFVAGAVDRSGEVKFRMAGRWRWRESRGDCAAGMKLGEPGIGIETWLGRC